MFWNISGIILSIVLFTAFAIQMICRILEISFFIPTHLIYVLITTYLIVTNKKYTERVLRFTILCILLSAILGLIQVTFF